MKALLFSILVISSVQFASAKTLSTDLSSNQNLTEQQQVLRHLEIAKTEINEIREILPSFLGSSVGKNLKNAAERIAFAEIYVSKSTGQGKYFCVLSTHFDGSYSGRGTSELEAKFAANKACVDKNDDFDCKRIASYKCEQQ